MRKYIFQTLLLIIRYIIYVFGNIFFRILQSIFESKLYDSISFDYFSSIFDDLI